MNRKLGALSLGVLLASGSASGVDLVLDADAVAKAGEIVSNTGEQISKLKDQLDEMKRQYDQLKSTYDSFTGPRNLGAVMDNPALRNYLPTQWQGVYDAVKRGGYQGLSDRAASIYQNATIFDSCAHISVAEEKQACEAMAVKPAQDKGLALDAYQQAESRINQFIGLMQQINATRDPKALAEIQGRVGVEQAMIQNEQIKMELYSMVAKAEDEMQRQQQREIDAKANARRGWASLRAPQFNN